MIEYPQWGGKGKKVLFCYFDGQGKGEQLSEVRSPLPLPSIPWKGRRLSFGGGGGKKLPVLGVSLRPPQSSSKGGGGGREIIGFLLIGEEKERKEIPLCKADRWSKRS